MKQCHFRERHLTHEFVTQVLAPDKYLVDIRIAEFGYRVGVLVHLGLLEGGYAMGWRDHTPEGKARRRQFGLIRIRLRPAV